MQNIEAQVNEYLQVHTNKYYFSGSVLIARNGNILISKGYGMANYELDVPNTPQTKFRIASITKQFTAIAIMQLQEKNLLVDPKIYEAYIGEYELAPNFMITITKENDQIFAQATAQSKVEIYPESETEFFYTLVYAQITFVKNEKGEVTELILYQNGQEMPAKKIN